MEEKIMKKTTLTALVELVSASTVDNRQELLDDLNAEVARVEAKAAYKSPAQLAKAEKNEKLYNGIYALMQTADAPLTVADMREQLNLTCTAQRVTYAVNRLVNDGKLLRTYDKRKATYTLA